MWATDSHFLPKSTVWKAGSKGFGGKVNFSCETWQTLPYLGDQGQPQQWWIILTVWLFALDLSDTNGNLPLWISSFPKHSLKSIYEKNIRQYQLRGIVLSYLGVLLESFKVIKKKDELRKCPSQKKCKETRRLNIKWYPGWDPRTEKRYAKSHTVNKNVAI